MTNLKCSVQGCAHFDNDMCCLNSIKICGDDAKTSSDTACKSYCKEGSFLSNFVPTGKAELQTEIHCSAVNCIYNQNNMCNSSTITVDSLGNSDKGGTECASYTPKAF